MLPTIDWALSYQLWDETGHTPIWLREFMLSLRFLFPRWLQIASSWQIKPNQNSPCHKKKTNLPCLLVIRCPNFKFCMERLRLPCLHWHFVRLWWPKEYQNFLSEFAHPWNQPSQWVLQTLSLLSPFLCKSISHSSTPDIIPYVSGGYMLTLYFSLL